MVRLLLDKCNCYVLTLHGVAIVTLLFFGLASSILSYETGSMVLHTTTSYQNTTSVTLAEPAFCLNTSAENVSNWQSWISSALTVDAEFCRRHNTTTFTTNTVFSFIDFYGDVDLEVKDALILNFTVNCSATTPQVFDILLVNTITSPFYHFTTCFYNDAAFDPSLSPHHFAHIIKTGVPLHTLLSLSAIATITLFTLAFLALYTLTTCKDNRRDAFFYVNIAFVALFLLAINPFQLANFAVAFPLQTLLNSALFALLFVVYITFAFLYDDHFRAISVLKPPSKKVWALRIFALVVFSGFSVAEVVTTNYKSRFYVIPQKADIPANLISLLDFLRFVFLLWVFFTQVSTFTLIINRTNVKRNAFLLCNSLVVLLVFLFAVFFRSSVHQTYGGPRRPLTPSHRVRLPQPRQHLVHGRHHHLLRPPQTDACEHPHRRPGRRLLVLLLPHRPHLPALRIIAVTFVIYTSPTLRSKRHNRKRNETRVNIRQSFLVLLEKGFHLLLSLLEVRLEVLHLLRRGEVEVEELRGGGVLRKVAADAVHQRLVLLRDGLELDGREDEVVHRKLEDLVADQDAADVVVRLVLEEDDVAAAALLPLLRLRVVAEDDGAVLVDLVLVDFCLLNLRQLDDRLEVDVGLGLGVVEKRGLVLSWRRHSNDGFAMSFYA